MAKRRSIKPTRNRSGRAESRTSGARSDSREVPPADLVSDRLASLAVAALAALLVYALYYPADSIAVELGDAVYLSGGGLLFGWLAWLAHPAIGSWRAERWSLLLDLAVGGLALWMVVSTLANASHVNLRMAVNETWLWIAGAALFSGGRRCLLSAATRNALVLLIIALGCGLAVHGWHQSQVSLPADQARYEADPETVLREAGIEPVDAPVGSAQRMNFENRLFDGGPTATFALANSFAAPLLISWVLAVGIFLQRMAQFRSRSLAARDSVFLGTAVAVIGIVGVVLLWTHSRSAVGSALLACLGLIADRWYRSGGARRTTTQQTAATWMKRMAVAAAGLLVLVIGGAVWFASRGELLERALPSVWFRLQYWRSTLALAFDVPWFGCGPGNFQACYEAYRQQSASEQIAEPHNWLMETLAAGGFPAVFWLGLAIVSMAMLAMTRRKAKADLPATATPCDAESADEDRSSVPPQSTPDHSAAVWWGSGLGGLAVWLLGGMIGLLPDVAAQLYAVPLALLMLVGLARGRSADAVPATVVAIALLAAMLHLSFAGGWTVPGVVLPIWILAASLLPVRELSGEQGTNSSRPGPPEPACRMQPFGEKPSRGTRLAVLLVGLLLLVMIQKTAVSPHQQWTIQSHRVSAALAAGRLTEAKAALRQAMQSDPWNPRPAMELAALQQAELLMLSGDELSQSEAAGRRQADMFGALEQFEEEAVARAPRDPALWRWLARQRLHLFQRWGRPQDLELALQRLQRGFQLAPAQQALAAQIAVIELQQGRSDEANAWAERAAQLAEAGGHVERQLDRTIVLIPRKLGAAVSEQPQQVVASVPLANLLEH